MKPAPSIRGARLGDIPRILHLLTLLHAETPHAPLDGPRLREGVEECLSGGAIIVSCDAAVLPVATLGLCIESPWFSRQDWLCDRWMFVHPQHRHTPHGVALLQAAVLAAEQMKLPLQLAVNGIDQRTAGKIRLFSRVVGAPTGAIWNVKAP